MKTKKKISKLNENFKKTIKINNFVAKNSFKFNKPKIFKNKKKEAKLNIRKTKIDF